MKPFLSVVVIICLLITFPFFSCKEESTKVDTSIVKRSYCSEIGSIDLVFYEDEVSGSYVLLPKESLGAIWGKLDNLVMTGRWIDEDGSGIIIITFNDDFSWFSTAYNNYEDPEKWYRDSWHGQLRTTSKNEFSVDGKTYKCE